MDLTSIRPLFRSLAVIVCCWLPLVLLPSSATAQFNNGFQRSVGGVMVDTERCVPRAASLEQRNELTNLLQELVAGPGRVALAADLRVVSLKDYKPRLLNIRPMANRCSEEILFLAGLHPVCIC